MLDVCYGRGFTISFKILFQQQVGVDEVPDTVIENNELYYTFIVVVQTDLTNLGEYFNQHIIDEVSRPFSHHCHVEKS